MKNIQSPKLSLSKYVSKKSNSFGNIDWSNEENEIWQLLITRQLECINNKACDEYIQGLSLLNLPLDHIPQLGDVNKVLKNTTGWECVPVPALINFDRFFYLLANKKFPVATFIRHQDELDYLQEPDIFHEIFGHCAMLTHPAFASFTHCYGKLGAAANAEERKFLARLYWFTVEFGLINCNEKRRIYGGGILSSPKETNYAYNSSEPIFKRFDPIEVMRTPYRIDILQPIYFVLDDIEQLYQLAHRDVNVLVAEAKAKGLRTPKFEQ